MRQFEEILDSLKSKLKSAANMVAKWINHLSRGRLKPQHITLVGLIAHLPIAWLIATGSLGWAAILLVIFGLFDSLDGALARVQNRESLSGMFLDSTADRLKEVGLYIGIAYYLVSVGYIFWSAWAVAALGFSLLVSYANAWGEVVMARLPGSTHQVNQEFRGGVARFEVRISLLIVGLAFNQLVITIVLVSLLSLYTFFQRATLINRCLK